MIRPLKPYHLALSSVTGVHGRTVAVWTLLSCTLCFLCAFNLGSKPLYAATFLSFVYALGYLAVECFVYHTIRAASLTTFIFVAGTASVFFTSRLRIKHPASTPIWWMLTAIHQDPASGGS